MILGMDRHLRTILLVCAFLAAVALFVMGRALSHSRMRGMGIGLAVLATAVLGLFSFLAWLDQPD